MKRRARVWGGLVFAIVAAVAVVLFAISKRTGPVSPVEQVPTTWKDAREAPMHVHHVGTKKIKCAECHTASDIAPTEAVCVKCHEPEAKRHHRGGAQAQTTCLSCHVFGANKAAATCNACHAKATRAPGAPALDHHASVDLPCGGCHSVHGEERAVLADCTTCHRTASVTHGAFEVHARSERPSLDASSDLSLDASALALMREAGAPTIASRDRDASSGELAHATALDPRFAMPGQVCTACHEPHSAKKAARATCEGCHVGARAARESPHASVVEALANAAPHIGPRGPRVAAHEGCITCHEPHRARRTDVRSCEGCHADHRGVSAVRGHAKCTSCHLPHAPAEARLSCSVTCHSNVAVLAAPRVAAHADCSSCHDPHRPDVSAGRSCVRCHESVAPSHPLVTSAKGEQACTGCHAPHATERTAHAGAIPTAASCTSCHMSAKDDHALHAGRAACTACHAPHAFKLTGVGASLCSRCHDDKVTATRGRPGHASCNACHGEAHAPVAKPSCGGCHADEARTAPRGHSVCTSCHDAHSGSLGAGASCTSCHENKAHALHANVGGGCGTCHRPHAVPRSTSATFHAAGSPPSCSTCHAKPSLKGLHEIGAHASCSTCHVAHGPPRSDRATCTATCHADRRDHQPEAQVCKGCHLFKH